MWVPSEEAELVMQQRLFVGAPVILSLIAVYVVPSGWSLTVRCRLDGEPWCDAEERHYHGLTSEELADVMAIEALDRLRIR